MDLTPHIIPSTYSGHHGAHICSQDCKFVWQRSRLQCQKTGLEHICDYRCLASVSGEGNLVCLWTGRVCTHSGTSVDNRYENNLPRSGDGETEGSRYGVRSLGYGPPNAIKHASAARERNMRQLPVWGGTPLLSDLSSSSAHSVASKSDKRAAEQTPRWGGPKNRRRTAKRRSKTEDTATVTKSSRKPTSGLTASPAVRAKQRGVARKLSSNIFFNQKVRQKARAISLEKIKHLYVKTLKKYVEACESKQHTPLCVTEVVAVYASCASSVPLPIDIVYSKKKSQPVQAREGVMQSHVPAVKDTEDLQVALTNFLVDGWQKLSATAMWMDAAPDFGCYVLGMIYLCSAGGLDVAGINVIPALPFFMTHTPDPSFLTQLCAHMGQKDCRSSEFGRARITIGMNSIKSALQHEQKHGTCDLSHFVVDAPTLLAQSYEDAEKESIWHVDNIV